MDVQNLTTAEKWDLIYNYFGVKDFMYFISSPALQNELLPAKIIFIFFTAFFLCAVIYFYINSSYLRYQFLQDTSEFLSWQPYELRDINKRWKKIVKKTASGAENDYKLTIIEADDFLYQVLQERGSEGDTFEELVHGIAKKIPHDFEDILSHHKIRDSIVHETDYALDLEKAKKILSDYEKAIKDISAS